MAARLTLSNNQIMEAIAQHGGIRAAGRALGLGESTLRMRLKRAMSAVLVEDGSQAPEEQTFIFSKTMPPKPVFHGPDAERVRRFIVTAAQDSSAIHEDFWNCLNVYADWFRENGDECEIIVSGFAYSKKLFQDNDTRSAKIGFHPTVAPFVSHDRIFFGETLAFCADYNTQPTAKRPLSGCTVTTKERWGIFPHVKVALESVPTTKNKPAKQIMTTGAVTLPNYIRMKAGITAMFHHVCGAVLVELHPDGTIHCRHLLATSLDDGSFYDLDTFVTSTGVTDGHRVEAITFGDIHHEKLDPAVAMATWGYDVAKGRVDRDAVGRSLVGFLRPNYEFYHDLSDFSPRNHHNIKDHHFRFALQQHGQDSVEGALRGCAVFLKEVTQHRLFETMPVVIASNHDLAFIKWLKSADYRDDPANALFFLQQQAAYYSYIAAGISDPPIFEDFLKGAGCPRDVVFMNEDESFLVKGIECGMHGHLGANGARAAPMQFAKSGARSNTGHTHSPTIIDGAYVAGVSGKLDMGYNKGPSSWAQAHIVVYPNGKRAILTLSGGRFFG